MGVRLCVSSPYASGPIYGEYTMKLKDLKAAGGFVSADNVKKSVTWTNTEGVEYKFDIFVRRASFGSMERLLMADDDRSKSAQHIADCVLIGELAEPMTYEDAYALEPSLAKAILEKVREVNGGNTDPN